MNLFFTDGSSWSYSARRGHKEALLCPPGDFPSTSVDFEILQSFCILQPPQKSPSEVSSEVSLHPE